ncbi:hypothetical protein [Mariluticola halotolerans]|uniref:hypothetical protein n=1 Tax=Mariluticola halotolerans TaxID=2909283 RepID=UPI0026E16900|nr:hypothetical protein [Mariluticola halotolerans]UJQ95802.1 hypothetical protein L1P08_07405 [Mariluticola halotolerans]
MFLFADTDAMIQREQDERQLALEYIAEAWNSAEQDGVEGEALAHAALFAAIATLVKTFGEEATAELVARLPDRIRHGEYSLDRVIQ